MKKLSAFLCVTALVFGSVGFAQATLWDRGGGLVYDDVLNITWLQDGNYAATELSDQRVSNIISAVSSIAGHSLVVDDFQKDTYGAYTGRMTWWGAMAWADQLVYGGYHDWRLPSAYNYIDGNLPKAGYVSGSEMGYMYYNNLGGSPLPYPIMPGGPIPSPTFTDGHGDTVSFQNLQSFYYWLGEESSTYLAWMYYFFAGVQVDHGKVNNMLTWAVRDGDVAPVPEPATMLLLASGLVGVAGFRRKLHKS